MNVISHDMIGHFMEIYNDDGVVKSNSNDNHLVDSKDVVSSIEDESTKMYLWGPVTSSVS